MSQGAQMKDVPITLPPISLKQLNLLIRGVDALGTWAYGGWSEEEKSMKKMLEEVRTKLHSSHKLSD